MTSLQIVQFNYKDYFITKVNFDYLFEFITNICIYHVLFLILDCRIFMILREQMKKFFLISVIILLFTACHSEQPVNEKQAEECALHFAQNFFNFKYKEALNYCTMNSTTWMKFYVSNISRSDIYSIQKVPQLPQLKIQKVEKAGTDSTAEAYCKVENCFLLDSIGRSGHMVKKAIFKIKLVLENNSWKVKLDGMQRYEN